MEKWKDLLLKITEFEFKAQTTQNSKGWQGSGSGKVIVEITTPEEIIFRETGKVKLENGKQLSCNNTYRWLFEGNLIKLDHLRFGMSNPVYLFHLTETDSGSLKSTCPHLCDKDEYQAMMEFSSGKIWLRWTVKGPEKDESINYCYY